VVLPVILSALALLSLVLTLWQWAVAIRFPLHRRSPAPAPTRGVTLLKPLKGCEQETAACLRSWLEQDDAGPIQVLLGVASSDDPVCAVVRQVLSEHPQCDARLVICPDSVGPNAKVSTLTALEPLISHEVVVISDADVWAPPDLLNQLLAGMKDSETGLVCSFYRLTGAANLAMRWEAQAANGDFWSSVLQARSLKPLDFALGAVMALSRADLVAIGGLRELADYLADDYQLGHRLAAQGRRIALCPVVVECRSSPMTWREVWAHQLRWSRTIRVCQPGPYFFSILSNATLWPLLWLAVCPGLLSAAGAGVCLALRLLSARYCERKLAGPCATANWWLAPVKDLFQVPVWALAFTGNRVTWRGRRFRVSTGGKLAACASDGAAKEGTTIP
jgi:ceramide glucosyltransferase